MRRLESAVVYALLAFIFALAFAVGSSDEKNNGVAASTDSLPVESSRARADFADVSCSSGMDIYTLHFCSVDLVCGERPSIKDSSVVYCAEASFTGECLTEFKHFNIAGNHVSNGHYHKGFRCKANTGAFVFYDNRWKFLRENYDKEFRLAEQQGGMAFAQNLIIYNSKVMPLFRKDKPLNVYRTLCELYGKLRIIESRGSMAYSEYVETLRRLGVRHALYLDMGEGWNFSWYRDRRGGLHVIHPKMSNSVYQTNWIVFR